MLTRDSMKHVRITDAEEYGTVQEGLTVIEKSSGCFHVTKITLPDPGVTVIEPTSAADLADGLPLYEFPEGECVITHVIIDIEFKSTDDIEADTPDIGLGMKIASGATATLGEDTDFEDVLTGQTASGGIETDVDSMTVVKAVEKRIDPDDTDRTLHLNVADGWADAGTLDVKGTIIIHWTAL
jgi:hypothetical protein